MPSPTPLQIVLISQEPARAQQLRRGWETLAEDERQAIAIEAFTPAELRARRDAAAVAITAANVVIVSHVLVDDDAAAVTKALDENLKGNEHVLVLNSLQPLMRRTRLGWFKLSEMSRFAALPPGFEVFGRLLEDQDISSAVRDLRAQLPAMLAKVKPQAGDLRLFLCAAITWMEPTPANMARLILGLADRYGPGAGRFEGRYGDPDIHPLAGLYHPKTGITEDLDRLTAALASAPGADTVGLLLVRGAVLSGDHAAHDAIIDALERRGLRVIPVFSDSFDYHVAIDRFVAPAGAVAIVNPTGFPLTGGHNRSMPGAAAEFLAARGLLYFTPSGLMVQDVAQWERSQLGLAPIEVAMQPAIHEMEGGIETLLVHGTKMGERSAFQDRVERFAARVGRWLSLRKKPNAEKRVLLTIFAFPPSKGAVGTAAYLDVMRSACAILERLAAEGYDVERPDSPESLLARIVEGEDKSAPMGSALLAAGARLSVAEYERIAPDSRRIEKLWGSPPGALTTDGRDILIHGTACGRVFVGVQPSFGYEGDPMRLLFAKDASPHHGFLGYYAWAEHVFKADAMIHLGTHGALEFMPGKQTGLSSACWPDVLAGTLPNIYLYAINNPSEGTIAKRRGYAATIGHLTPPADAAGLYRELSAMKEMIADFRANDGAARRERIVATLIEKLSIAHFDREIAAPADRSPESLVAFVGRLYAALIEIETRRIPIGLHIVGRRPEPAERIEVLAAIGDHDRPETSVRAFPALLLEARRQNAAKIAERALAGDLAASDLSTWASATWRTITATAIAGGAAAALDAARTHAPEIDLGAARRTIDLVAQADAAMDRGDEIGSLVAALGGRPLAPGPGGDPVRSPDVLPTGRNMHALDPARVPSAAALREARIVVDELLARRTRELGRWPRSIGLVLWGLDNIKTQGEAIAQAFLLLGVLPKANSIGRMSELEVVPLEQLGRPRVDVLMTVSGIFRDIFGSTIELLDRAVRTAAALDEPLEMNYVRARAVELMAEHGLDEDTARSRVFSNAPGHYGAHVDHMVQMSLWHERGDLASLYQKRKGFVFGAGRAGVDSAELLGMLAGALDTTFQNLDSSEVSITDVDHYFEYLGGLTALAEKESGRRPDAIVADTTGQTVRLRTLAETVRLEVRTKILNPKWYEGMLRHGYEGVEEIKKRLDYTFGWSATCEAVDDWVYRETQKTFVDDESVRSRMQAANPHSYHAMLNRLIEAESRGFWRPTGDEHERLHALASAAEDAIEGVA